MNKNIILTATLALTFAFAKGQNLFPEKFSDCGLTQFCLDCGDTKGVYNGDLNSFFAETFQSKSLKNIEGTVFVQVLIDTTGKQCVISIGNKAKGKVSKLELLSFQKHFLQHKSKYSEHFITYRIVFEDMLSKQGFYLNLFYKLKHSKALNNLFLSLL